MAHCWTNMNVSSCWHVCMYVCMCVFACVCLHACMFIYMYAFVYVCKFHVCVNLPENRYSPSPQYRRCSLLLMVFPPCANFGPFIGTRRALPGTTGSTPMTTRTTCAFTTTMSTRMVRSHFVLGTIPYTRAFTARGDVIHVLDETVLRATRRKMLDRVGYE